MKFLTFVPFILSSMFFSVASADTAVKYEIELDWQEVEDAKGYDVEFQPVAGKRAPIRLRVKNPSWKGGIPIGLYSVRMRSLDSRLVPGAWSQPSELAVLPPPPKILQPQKSVKSNSAEEGKVRFGWEPVVGAYSYLVSVKSDDGKYKEEKEVKGTALELTLPVAKKYSWEVYSLVDGFKKEHFSFNVGQFLHIGEMPAPEIIVPTSELIDTLEWKAVPEASGYSFSIYHKSKTGQWKRVRRGKTKAPQTKIPPKFPGGNYRLEVAAFGANRSSAKPVQAEFALAKERGPAAIETARLQESVVRPSVFHAIGSYIITNLDYQALNPEQGTRTVFSALGGAARAGLGYSPKGDWGGMGFLEFSGFTVSGQTFTYFTSEMHANYRRNFGSHVFNAYIGGYIKELPETVSSVIDPNKFELEKVRFMGPLLGTSYAIPLSHKLGVQFNGRLYYSLISLGTPNGEGVKGALPFQVSLLGSYRFTRNITGLFGYAFKKDTVSYGAVSSDASPDSFAAEGEVNSISVSGHYLNLMLEWGF